MSVRYAIRRALPLLAVLAGLALQAAPAVAQTSPSLFTSATRYDALGRVTGTISPDPDSAGPLPFRAVRNTYDAAGRLVLVETGTLSAWQSELVAPSAWGSAFTVFQSVATTHDAMGRKLSDTLSSGGTAYSLTQYSYTGDGRLLCTAVRMNPAAFASPPAACEAGAAGSFGHDRITHNTYDPAGHLLQVQEAYDTDEAAVEVTRTYTRNGRVETLTDGNSNVTNYVYDGLDRLWRTCFPGTTACDTTPAGTADYEQLTYDANANVTSRRLRDATSIALAYDALNRLTTRDLPGSEPTVTYGYDLLGRMITAVDANGLTSGWSYDALGRTTGEQHGSLGLNVMQYDVAGRLSRLTWPDTFYVTYDYLVTGEVTAVRENGATSGVGVLATFGYDDLGRRTLLTRGNGTSTSYGYDPVSRLTDLDHDLVSAGTDLALDFTRNPASQLVTRAGAYGVYAYTDRANANVTDTINGLNQVTATGATSLSHDARGNITAIGSSAYAYTAENRLVSAPASATLTYWPTGALAAANSPITA